MTLSVEISSDQRQRLDRIAKVKGAEVISETLLDDSKTLLILRKK